MRLITLDKSHIRTTAQQLPITETNKETVAGRLPVVRSNTNQNRPNGSTSNEHPLYEDPYHEGGYHLQRHMPEED